MSLPPENLPDRFCPDCGGSVISRAKYCSACGVDLRGSARPAETSQKIGLVILSMFLAVGIVLWFLILKPAETPERHPLAARDTADQSTSAGVPEAVPPDHPPITIPDEVQRFIASLEAEAAANPKDVDTWRNLAQVQYRAGQVERSHLGRAEESFRHVLELDSKNLAALQGLGNIYFDRDEYGKALEMYSAYLGERPTDVSVRTDLGTMYLYSGKISEAVTEYLQALEQDPDFFQAHFNLGVAYTRQNQTEKAQASLSEAIRLSPDDETRTRIEAVITRLGDSGASDSGTFQERVETSLRRHEIAGPKVVAVEWTAALEGRVLLDNFPMQDMPEFARKKFLGRIERNLSDAKQAFGAEGSARLELVDQTSGTVMATVTAE